MRKRAMKFVSLVLVMAVISTCCIIAAVSASATAGDTIYFDNSVTNFSTPYCYTWGDGGNGNWPGKAMTKVKDNIWAYNLTNGDSNVIFSNNGSNQSADLTVAGNNKLATPTGTGDRFTVNWTDYDGEQLPTSNTQPSSGTTPTSPSTPSGGAGTIYCQNDKGWSAVYCYMWNSDSDNNAGWPGVKMTDTGDGVWEYTYPKSFANVIFSNNGQDQTADIKNWASSGNNIYNNSTGAWDVHSTSPVKITALTTSLASPSYTNCSITINATAKSDAGNLSYKFTANGIVISSGASSSATWVPTSAGTYKLAVEVTDGAGNSNTRSVNFEIKDGSNLAEAYISGFSNSLGTRTQIKRNTAITFTTSAIGGKTGNNLLFYKFQITAPDGSNNVAYYTTGKTYSYTPTQLGTYTIKASVQNSYNNTVTNTYTYTSVDTINEQEPTTPSSNPTTPSSSSEPTTPSSSSDSTTPSSSDNTPTVLKGDADGNGKVDINDVTFIQLYRVEIPYYIQNIKADLADVTGDNQVKIQDANRIQQYLAGIISQL